MHECPSKDKDIYTKGKKVLQNTLELDDEGSENCLSEFDFMAIEEEKEETFEMLLSQKSPSFKMGWWLTIVKDNSINPSLLSRFPYHSRTTLRK